MEDQIFYYKFKREDRSMIFYGLDGSMNPSIETIPLKNYYIYEGDDDESKIVQIYQAEGARRRRNGFYIVVNPKKPGKLRKIGENSFWIIFSEFVEHRIFYDMGRKKPTSIPMLIGILDNEKIHVYDEVEEKMLEMRNLEEVEDLQILIVPRMEDADNVDIPGHIQICPILDIVESFYPFYRGVHIHIIYKILCVKNINTSDKNYYIEILRDLYTFFKKLIFLSCASLQQNMDTFFLYKGDYIMERNISELCVQRKDLVLKTGIHRDVYLQNMDIIIGKNGYPPWIQNWIYRTLDKVEIPKNIIAIENGFIYSETECDNAYEFFHFIVILNEDARIFIRNKMIFWTGTSIDILNRYPLFPHIFRKIVIDIILNGISDPILEDFIEMSELKDFHISGEVQWYDIDGKLTKNPKEFSVDYYLKQLEVLVEKLLKIANGDKIVAS